MHDMTPATIAEDWLQSLHSTDSAWLVTDDQLQAVHLNAGFTRLLGYTLEDFQGQRPLQKLLSIQDNLPPHIAEQLSLNGSFTGELLVCHRNGRQLWLAATVNTLDRQPLPLNAQAAEVIVLTDIGFTKKFEALQRQTLEDVVSEKPLPELLNRLCEGIESLTPPVRACVMSVNSEGIMQPLAAPSLPPHIVDLMRDVRIGALVGACGAAAFLGTEVVTHTIAQEPNWHNAEKIFTAANLHACWSSPIKNHDGLVIGTFALYFDRPRAPNALHRQLVMACLHLCAIAFERDASKSRIQRLAFYDTLTQLPNRAMFHECAKQALHMARGTHALLLSLNLDRFKLWNDNLGHGAGDALLREISQRLSACLGLHHVLARLSSDEFAILQPFCLPEDIEKIAVEILEAIAKPFSVKGVVTIPNACIGISVYPDDGTDVETLLRHADQAMVSAKKQGCQIWRRYHPSMAQISMERADMERALRQALEHNALSLHYQPQILSQQRHQIYGLEALARWHHESWGWVAPPRFIAVAEDSGLIHKLTRWLIDSACAQLAQWRAQGLRIPHVAINLSTKNFHDPMLAHNTMACIHKHGLQPSDLMLEITESLMLDTSPETQSNLQDLHSLGLRFSMDDFGTGYSSLSYLHRLPISELKLDKSFVQDITSNSAASALTRSVINIASSLKMTLVAEGVETKEQAQWLTEHGCPVMQGYLYAKPMPTEAVPQWLRQSQQPQRAA